MRAYVISLLAMLALDQGSKWAVVHGMGLKTRHYIDVVPPWLQFRMGWNEGINFGLLSGQPDAARWILIAVAIVISIWVTLWARRDGRVGMMIAAGVLVGGALGNVLDRVVYGAVADFLNMSCCGIANPYVFNLADVGIFAGAIALVIWGKSSA
ncbi:signal peptidase II [Pseudoruegeria sp. SK021]|uniref:signal peptidase II n=1 Tax=Pseudoruegeria sp. SK021 TaxID=1933035 RepID=UPI000A22793E|nr:signal peptidase II [Pseudoruegeria sp. SK021]OSP55032.1 signal peptidase II [Pseudoruegeria sp. SK021]